MSNKGKIQSFILTLAIFLASSLPSIRCKKVYTGPPANLVIKSAKIVTIDKDNPRAEAVAIKGEFIIAVTSNSKIDQYIDKGATEVIDANGRLVIPGFNDAHCHFGPIDPDYVDLRYITDSKTITERIKKQVAKSKPGELIRGGRWEHELFPDKQWPTKELIDPISSENPVVLSRIDGHSVLVNSYVIKNSGITKDTPDPFGGEIQRNPVTGEPTGIFKESAKRLLKYGAVEKKRTPEEERQREIEEWQAAFDMAARYGVTTVQLPGYSDPQMYQYFKDKGKLTLRVTLAGRLTSDKAQLAKYDEMRKLYPRENNWIRFGYLKGFLDGTFGSGTALMFKPFEDEPKKSGLPQMTYEELERRVLSADKMGFQIGVHAIGTKANHWLLNAYEKAQQVSGKRDSRYRSEHASILTSEDIARFAQLGIVASMQPAFICSDIIFAEKRIGYDRCKGAYAYRRLLDAGAPIAFGTDYSVEPINPLEGLYGAVTRKDRAGYPEEGWFPNQRLTIEKAIELYTLGSAFAEFMEDRKGMIKVGYLADMVILNNDLLTIPPDEIMHSRVDWTIVGGKVVYKSK